MLKSRFLFCSRTTLKDCRRRLLVERKPKCDTWMRLVRDEVKQIVGSSTDFRGSRDAKIVAMEWSKTQHDLPARSMVHSYYEAIIPLKTELRFRQKYINFFQTVRVGRLIEDLDTLAVRIAYKHNAEADDKNPKSPLSFVTACVDQLTLWGIPIAPDMNILLRGHVTWVGESSIEVTMVVEQDRENGWEKMLDTTFLMVARDPRNKRKAAVCPLKLTTDEEKRFFQTGEKNKLKRQEKSKKSLLKQPPDVEERILIHDLFLKTVDVISQEPRKGIFYWSASFKHPVKPANTVWMEDTILKNVFICFPEQRNMYNKIFGGFLMRVAFELAFVSAWVHCCDHVMVVGMDDIMFQQPVEIGSVLYLISQIVYTQDDKIMTKVQAEVVDPKTGDHATTNTFYFLLQCTCAVTPVMPRSYDEYMGYLDGQRHFTSIMKTKRDVTKQ